MKMPVQEYFELYARYFEDAPKTPYAIRVGSKTLFSDDTYELRQKLGRLFGVLKRKGYGASAVRIKRPRDVSCRQKLT